MRAHLAALLRRPRQSLEARLVGSFLALSLVTVASAATLAYRSARATLAEAVREHLTSVSSLKQAELERWVAEELELIELIAGQPHLRLAARRDAADTVDLGRTVSDLARTSDDYREVFVLASPGGRTIASSDADLVGRVRADELFFREGRTHAFIQSVHDGPFTGLPTLTIATPVRDPDGEVVAVLGAHLSLERVERVIRTATEVHESEEAYLVTAASEILAAGRSGRPRPPGEVHSPGIAAALAGETGAGLYSSHRGVPVIGAYRWLPELALALVVEVTQEEAFAPAGRLLLKVLLFGLAATLALTVGVRLIARSVVRPITAVADAAAMVAGGDFTTHAPERGSDEVGDLARSFNSMTGRLRELYANLENQVEVSTTALSALEASRGLLRAIVDNSTALIAVTDPEGRVMIANKPLQQLVGVGEGEYLGEPLDHLLPMEVGVQWLDARRTADDKATVVQREVEWPAPDGPRTYLCTWFPLAQSAAGPEGIGLIATDLTERRRVEEERRRIEAQFRHAQKLESLGVLAGGIAHDFNNILAAILGHADLAALCVDDDPAETAEHLDQVVAAARRAADLTNQMLAYAGKASFRVERLDLNRSIREMSQLMEVSLPKKVSLRTELSPDPLHVRGDPAQVAQLVINLVTNGAQAIGDDAGIVTVSTASSVSADGVGRAVLRIQDTGSGMDAETLDRIFDPFFTTKEGGRGLGLAAVMGIVTSLDGALDVESEVGHGTTFRITFPLDTGTETDERGEAHEPGVGPAEGTILVVDDEHAVRSVAKRVLERQGFTVIEARDGLEALDVYRRVGVHVDAVVLDMSMPGMGGREVFDALRRADGGLPVLFTSGYDPSDAAGTLLDARHVGFLQKPYRPALLGEELQRLLRTATH